MKLIPIFIFLIFVIPVRGQNHFGIRSGVILSKQDYGYVGGGLSDYVTGMEVGAISRIHLFKGFYIQPELSFLQKGGKKDFILDKLKIKTNQLEFSMLLGYQFDIKRVSLYLNSGGFLGRVLSESTDGNPFSNLAYKRYFDNNWDYGVIFSSGFSLSVGVGKILLDFKYRYSENRFRLIELGSSPENVATTISIYNRGWGGTIGFCIPIGSRTDE
jgi:hypothetical protein